MYEAHHVEKDHSGFMKSVINDFTAKPQIKKVAMFLSASKWMGKIC